MPDKGPIASYLDGDLAREIARQDRFHPSGYPATRDGVFLGITTAIHELEREAIEAWRAERCRCETPLCGHAAWAKTAAELLQAAAVIMRTIRSIEDAATRAVHEVHDRYYLMHNHGPGTDWHAHGVEQSHTGDVNNPRANDHTGVPTGTWDEMRAPGGAR